MTKMEQAELILSCGCRIIGSKTEIYDQTQLPGLKFKKTVISTIKVCNSHQSQLEDLLGLRT